ARLPDQLGTLTGELMEPVASRLMASADALSALLSAASLVSILLPERAPHPRIYQSMHQLVGELTKGNFLSTYAQFELDLLAEGGFRLDLSACAATGATEELVYVSPKSGRAVSRAAGEPYKQKLLPLPAFFTKPAHCPPDDAEILAALQLTGYFLSHWMLEPHGRTLPAARRRLMQMFPSYAESA
ncbi:MAG: DNA repair protein RecO, partial [Alphaproteobacteria bacterium]|nr:DNA repair protein RecO [Alphaproteobacteria bacterium]